MGYVNTTDITKFISPFAIAKSAGTWTPTVSSNLVSDVRSAAGASFTLVIPIVLPGSSVCSQGAKLQSIDVFYKIATAAATAFSVALNKVSLNAHGVASAGAAVSVTLDTNHNTEAKRYAVNDHKMTLTLFEPVFLQQDAAFHVSCVITAAAGTVFTLFGAQINYDLRI